MQTFLIQHSHATQQEYNILNDIVTNIKDGFSDKILCIFVNANMGVNGFSSEIKIYIVGGTIIQLLRPHFIEHISL